MKRRQMLQASAGIGLLGVSNVKASDFSTANSARLVEVGFEHDVDLSEEQLQKSKIQFAADAPEYQLVDGDLYVTEFASDSAKEALTTEKNLVDFGSVHAASEGTLEADSRFNLVTRRSDGLEPISGVTTGESYAPPSVETKFSPSEVTVTTGGESVTVTDASEGRLELPSRTVEVQWHERTEKQVTEAKPPEEEGVVSTYEPRTTTATVTPVLTVKNRGVLSVKTGGER